MEQQDLARDETIPLLIKSDGSIVITCKEKAEVLTQHLFSE